MAVRGKKVSLSVISPSSNSITSALVSQASQDEIPRNHCSVISKLQPPSPPPPPPSTLAPTPAEVKSHCEKNVNNVNSDGKISATLLAHNHSVSIQFIVIFCRLSGTCNYKKFNLICNQEMLPNYQQRKAR